MQSGMPRHPAYKNMEVYQLSKKLVLACYELTHELPKDEAGNFIRYIRTAALSAHVNIASAAFSPPEKRKKTVREAKNAIIVIDAAVDILKELGFVTPDQTDTIGFLSASLLQLLDTF